MATTTPTRTDPDQHHQAWTSEIELRRFAQSKFAEGDKNNTAYPIAPDPARAEHFRPETTHSDYCNNHALKQLKGVTVYDDRLIVPIETTQNLNQSELWELLSDIVRFMRIDEYDGMYGTEWTRGDLDSNHNERQTSDPTKTDPRPIYVRVPRGHEFDKLQQLYLRRRNNGRTLLVIIIARDAATGTGKTTLACQLAQSWDTHGWTADRATLDPGTYADKYTSEDTPKKSVLLLDEAEQAADARRSMSGQNVKLSHLWATMRFREIYSIITLPSASMLDKRLKELADVKIVVHNRGTAVAYKTKIDDHDGSYRAKRLCRLRWKSMDDDPEYQKLTQKKSERMSNYAETFAYGSDEDSSDELDPEQAKRNYRRQVVERMSSGGWTQQEIADALPDISSRSTISKILNSD